MRLLELPEIDAVSGAGQSENPFGPQNIGGSGANYRAVNWSITSNGTLLNEGTYYFETDNRDSSSSGEDEGSSVHVEEDIEIDCPNQMLVTGVMLDRSILPGAVSGELGVGVETAGINSDGDIWLMGALSAGLDLRDLSGAQLAQAIASIGGVGVSGFATTLQTDEAGGDFQTSLSANLFGASASTDTSDPDCGVSAGAQIGSAQFSTTVSGNFALNLTDMAGLLGTSVANMLSDWDNSLDQLDQIVSDQINDLQDTDSDDMSDYLRDLFTPPGANDYDDLADEYDPYRDY